MKAVRADTGNGISRRTIWCYPGLVASVFFDTSPACPTVAEIAFAGDLFTVESRFPPTPSPQPSRWTATPAL